MPQECLLECSGGFISISKYFTVSIRYDYWAVSTTAYSRSWIPVHLVSLPGSSLSELSALLYDGVFVISLYNGIKAGARGFIQRYEGGCIGCWNASMDTNLIQLLF